MQTSPTWMRSLSWQRWGSLVDGGECMVHAGAEGHTACMRMGQAGEVGQLRLPQRPWAVPPAPSPACAPLCCTASPLLLPMHMC